MDYDCKDLMADIDAVALETVGCSEKYLYIEDNVENCPYDVVNSETGGPGDCF